MTRRCQGGGLVHFSATAANHARPTPSENMYLTPSRAPLKRKTRRTRDAFTLLEVILALAIFAGAIAVVGELVRLGARNARDTRDLTQAQLLCESTLAEVAAGTIVAEPVGPTPCEANPDWSYSLDVEATNAASLLSVRVTVAPTEAATRPGVQFALVRWLVDPEAVASAQQEADEKAEAAAAAKSSSSSSSSSSSGSSGSASSAAGS